MSRLGWIISIFAPAALVLWAAWPVAETPWVLAAPQLTEAVAYEPPVSGGAVGGGGCAAAGCHGAPPRSLTNGLDRSTWSCSATHWLACDPHSRAHEVLGGELANRIMGHLNAAEPGNPLKLKATEDVRCLACHTNPGLVQSQKPQPKDRPDGRLADLTFAPLHKNGVSCEACHGNASGWLHEHANWVVADRPGKYDTTQMVKLYDLGERARTCMGCHVGAPADAIRGYPVRDMNHDMIAAGHPRLNFDFADAQRRLPPHWYEKDRTKPGSPARGPDFDAQAWLIGRLAHAEAACDLLVSRASRGNEKDPAPWPEFAESACVSCHHVIANPDKPFPPPMPGNRRAGSPQWQPIWPVTRPDDLDALEPLLKPQKAIADLKKLLNAVEVPRPKLGNKPEEMPAVAKTAAESLAVLRQQLTHATGKDVRAGVDRLLRKGLSTPLSGYDRDIACQLFYGLAAAERTRMGWGEKYDAAPYTREWENLKLPPGKMVFAINPDDTRDGLKRLLR
jgi:hypothetical protein